MRDDPDVAIQLQPRILDDERQSAGLTPAQPCSACPRLTLGITPSDLVVRLIEAEAWVELGLWLIGWELPDWSVHQLCRGDHSWNCSIGIPRAGAELGRRRRQL